MAERHDLVVLLAILSFSFVSAANKRTLVLLDNWTIRETHSIFFNTLRGKHVSLDLIIINTAPGKNRYKTVYLIYAETTPRQREPCLLYTSDAADE